MEKVFLLPCSYAGTCVFSNGKVDSFSSQIWRAALVLRSLRISLNVKRSTFASISWNTTLYTIG